MNNNYYVEVLTEGALATLKEFAHDQAEELHQLAQFKPSRSIPEIETLVFNQVLDLWRGDRTKDDLHYDIPNYVLPIVSIEVWTSISFEIHTQAPCFPYTNEDTSITDEPLYLFGNVVKYWPALEPVEDYVELEVED